MIAIERLEQKVGEFSLRIHELRIARGITLLVGANGAGKSTLLELLATVQLPRGGSVQYDGRSAQEALPLLRSQIGYVPSDIELYEDMTVYKLLKYLGELKGMYHLERIEALLEDFRLSAYRNTRIKRLSAGIQRRIAIAQSLLASPQFLFLDEPLNGMDSAERKLVITYLNKYAEGRTIIAAVHELGEWEAASDRLLWLDHGQAGFYGNQEKWLSDLPYKVWQGRLTKDQFQFYFTSDRSIIEFREVDHGMMVLRVVAAEAPFHGWNEVSPTMEDAYFIRKFTRSR
ncbi:ATP-binding cassette domain-containing protein [Paenibacillus sp. GM2]|uniref:ATP-binding cassette domain-containing protein n=1 Tax=Paenibacillus sp. GM2 TaxID=1622070 RepID=UPI0008380AD6|nr:ABC transporter ATP-binding protein [Paenibacillus sp. GM2]